jgi:hypothetical protein
LADLAVLVICNNIKMNYTNEMIHRPPVFDPFTFVSAGQSTRHGGVSPAPWATLNLGQNTGDTAENVAENRRRFCAALGFGPQQLAWSEQVHSDQVRKVTTPGGTEGFDALITNVHGILLAVSVADCVPILVYDHEHHAIAAIHAGWRGTVKGIVTKTLDLMAAHFGSSGMHCVAYVGTCIDECSFEVGEAVFEAFDPPFKRFEEGAQRFFVDLKKANIAQCLDFGIPRGQIETSPFSTVLNNDDYFSHRLERGVTGRMMGAIGLKSR